IKCSGTLVACEVLDAKPRRVGRQILKDALNQGGSEATTAIVRIEIRLVNDVVRSVAPALGNANHSALCLRTDGQPAEGGRLTLCLAPPAANLQRRRPAANQGRVMRRM